MHLSTVHNSNYYSAPPSAANMTSTPCFNMSIGSRIMRHCRPCTSLNGTDATSLYAGPSSTHDFALLARNLDSRQSQGTHTMIIVGIIFAVALGCLCVAAIIGWSVKSNRAAFAKSGGNRGRVVRHGNAGSSEKDYASYQGDGGLDAPPKSARSNGPRFPVRSQPHHSARSNQERGPYQDSSPFSAVPTFESRGDQGRGRNQYSHGSQRSQR
jgi:hypothetical protein